MACSSNSIIQRSSSSSALMNLNKKYDVFVSFRGTDTRYSFTDHLFAALQRKGIVVFRDDTKLKKGKSIAPELLRAIQASQVFIVVFSKNYASSTWCLRELENILECAQVSGKCLLPVFYDVDPSEVRKQSGSYAEAFAEHEERFKHDLEILGGWREALTQVASLSGWDLRDKPQSVEIGKIIEEIINALGHKFSSLTSDLVGMDSPVEKLENFLLLDSDDDVRVVGICGMGGVGKTTLATVLYARLCRQFGACCFIDDVSKIHGDDGPIGVQKQILHQTLDKEHLQIYNFYDGANMVQSRLGHAKALIILDNVDHIEQLEKLGVNRKWLAAGSRIIIISRDAHILNKYGVDAVYKVPILNQNDSLQLFSRHALKRDNIMSNYEKLAYDILDYANGLPLAIKALGSFLSGRSISEWQSALARLRESPNKDFMKVLRLSFDGLEKMEKEIFLDIACFFNGWEEKHVKNILDPCGFHPEIGLRVLIDKSLISISDKGKIEMHCLFEELGRKIVQGDLSKGQWKWSRLWLPESFNDVTSVNMEKEVEAVVLMRKRCKRCQETKILMAEALSKMSHLRLLILYETHVFGSLNCLSNELRHVVWAQYPFMYLPSSFQPNQLVELSLVRSSIKQLWEGNKYLPNLRILNLSHSKNLIKMPDFGDIPNLELLNLEGCEKIVQIDPSIDVLRKLVYLNLGDCKNLISISNNVFGLSSLKFLHLKGCSKGFYNAMHLEKDDSSESASYSLSKSSIFKWIALPFRSTSQYQMIPRDLAMASCLLPSSLHSFSCLWFLDIRFCGVSQIPVAIGCLRWIESLILGGNDFVTLPSFKELTKLVCLNLEHCKHLESLPELPSATTIEKDLHLTSKYCRRKGGGLSIFNCPKLGDLGGSCSRVIFSWMIQLMQANQESCAIFHHIDIIIPGSEMPRWFYNQTAGSSISIDPSPILHDNNIIGIACCVVFYADPYHANMCWKMYGLATAIDLRFRSGHLPGVVHHIPTYTNLVMAKSKHIWLVYFSREFFFNLMDDIDNTVGNLIRMQVEIEECRHLYLGVKKCGYRWLSKQDLQQLEATMMPAESLA